MLGYLFVAIHPRSRAAGYSGQTNKSKRGDRERRCTRGEEPVAASNPLLKLENIVATPHVAGMSETANRNMSLGVASEILRVLRGEKPKALGNPELWPRLSHLR